MVDPHTRRKKEQQYRKEYWFRFRAAGKKRIYGTLSAQEFRTIKAIAARHGRNVFAQIWAESCAYRNQRFVPTKDIEAQIGALYVALRRIGTNVNQIARQTHMVGRLKRPAAVMEELARLEAAIAAFVSQPWKEEDDRQVDE